MTQERLVSQLVSAPAELAQSGSVTSAYADMCNRRDFTFLVAVGALAAQKGVKVELLGANDAEGSEAETVAQTTYTAGSDGESSHLIAVRGRVTPDWRYMAVKVSNLNTGAATTAAVLLVSDSLFVPDDSGMTVLWA